MTIDTTKEWYSFWKWLFLGYSGKAGFKIILTYKIIFDFLIGITISYFFTDTLSTIAPLVILPLLAAFIGLAIGIVNSVGALATSEEMVRAVKETKGGMVGYIYPFNLAILIIFATVFFWMISSSKIFDKICIEFKGYEIFPYEIFGFLLLSVSIRTCWETLNSYASLVLFVYEIKKKNL